MNYLAYISIYKCKLGDGLIQLTISAVWAMPYNGSQVKLYVCVLSIPGDNGLGRKLNAIAY